MRSLVLYMFLAGHLGLGLCREIVFPPVSGVVHDHTGRPVQAPLRIDNTDDDDDDDDVDLTTDAVGGLTSFAHLPFVPCFDTSRPDEAVDKYDIAVLGAPFDTGTSFRPGARFGPHGIRDGSRRVRGPHSWNVYSGRNAFEEWARLVDCGDAPLTFVDNTVALKQLGKAHRVSLDFFFLLLFSPLASASVVTGERGEDGALVG